MQDAAQGGPTCQQKAIGRFSERRDFLRESGEDILCRVSRVAVRMPGTTSNENMLEITSGPSQWLYSGGSPFWTECQADSEPGFRTNKAKMLPHSFQPLTILVLSGQPDAEHAF
jgi:hypothetical protein